MYDNAVILFSDLFAAVPNFFYKRAGGIVFFYGYTKFPKFFFYRKCCAKGRDEHDIIAAKGTEWNYFVAFGIL